MHEEIIRYSMNGEMGDGNILKRKHEMISFLKNQMRDMGCVPSIDVDPQFTLDYDVTTGRYNFTLSVYGVYVGHDAAHKTAGITSGKFVYNE